MYQNSSNLPLVSVIVPCRNEEKYIGRCLNSLILQDWPKDRIEVLVVNGASEDKTKEIIEGYSKKYQWIRPLENSKKYSPFGLNIGIKESKGEIIIRADAHAEYQKDYISTSIRDLRQYHADNVGGVIQPVSPQDLASIEARAIAFCLSHPFGAASRFRLGAEKPYFVDTVFGGCYKREVFDQIGLFNENLIRSQDLEFNLRLQKAGKKILLDPKIIFRYYPKTNLKEFFLHNIEDGIWAIYPLKFTKAPFKLRHYIPLFFVLGLAISGLLSFFFSFFSPVFLFILDFYFLLSVLSSLEIAVKQRNSDYFFLMPVVFACRHFGYGLGSVFGLIKILLP